jgi:hypothetical protein
MLKLPVCTNSEHSDISDFLEIFMSGISPAVIETGIRQEILSRVHGLPEAMCCGPLGFEFHLGENRGTCGIGFGLYNTGRDLDALFKIPCENYGIHVAEGQNARCFLTTLKQGHETVWRAIKAAWLEFDIGTDDFFGLFFSMTGYRQDGTDQKSGPGCEEVLAHLMNGLPGPNMDSPTGDRILRLISETEGLCNINHVGWMIGRGVDKLKIDLRVDGAAQVITMLEQVGLSEIAGDAEDILKVFQGVDVPIMVQFDVGAEVSQKAGLQFYSLGSA